jgi:hypothetical protein
LERTLRLAVLNDGVLSRFISKKYATRLAQRERERECVLVQRERERECVLVQWERERECVLVQRERERRE